MTALDDATAEPDRGGSADPPGHVGPARVSLTFEPAGKSVRVPNGVSVFDAALWNGVAIDSTCGGHGTCKKCKVKVLDASIPITVLDQRAFTAEQLDEGWRLACMATAMRDLTVDVPS